MLLALILLALFVAEKYRFKRRARSLIARLLAGQQPVSGAEYRGFVFLHCPHCYCPKLVEYCEYQTVKKASAHGVSHFGYHFLVTECTHCSRRLEISSIYYDQVFEGKRDVNGIHTHISLAEALALWELKRLYSDRGVVVTECVEPHCRNIATGKFEVGQGPWEYGLTRYKAKEVRYLCAQHGWLWREKFGPEWKMFYYPIGKNPREDFDQPKEVERSYDYCFYGR